VDVYDWRFAHRHTLKNFTYEGFLDEEDNFVRDMLADQFGRLLLLNDSGLVQLVQLNAASDTVVSKFILETEFHSEFMLEDMVVYGPSVVAYLSQSGDKICFFDIVKNVSVGEVATEFKGKRHGWSHMIIESLGTNIYLYVNKIQQGELITILDKIRFC
jgi:hypothetical protein